jgi:hypothetical protein
VKIRSPQPVWFRSWNQRVILVATLLLFTVTTTPRADANPRTRPWVTTPGAIRQQPPPYRLRAMGDLFLSVRDVHTRVNLWDFAGVSAGAGIDRDSTSLDLWVSGGKTKLDATEDGTTVETFKSLGGLAAAEGVIRFSETLSLGLDAGAISREFVAPYSDEESVSLSQTFGNLILFGSGRLTGPILWGLSGMFGAESAHRQWWQVEREGDNISLGDGGTKLSPPSFFFPDRTSVNLLGIGGSLAYWDPRLGSGALYANFRSEDIVSKQDGQRHVYDVSQPRDITTLGAAFIYDGLGWGEVGIDFGKEYWETIENFRFTVSGGSTSEPFQGRGNRAYPNRTIEFFTFRLQADVPGTKLTVGGWAASRFDRFHQTPAMNTINDFNPWVITQVTADTLDAPPLVKEQLEENRIIEFAGGASYKLRDESIIVGLEVWWYRNAVTGLDINRRPQGWELRLGGEWLINEKWEARAGWTRLDEDRDWLTLLNEWNRNRLTLGGRWYPGAGWWLDGYLWADWWRTAYADPRGPGGTGQEFGLMISKEF